MALNYLELHSRLHKLSNKTKITQFGIQEREIHNREVGTKTRKQLKINNNKSVLFYCILNLENDTRWNCSWCVWIPDLTSFM